MHGDKQKTQALFDIINPLKCYINACFHSQYIPTTTQHDAHIYIHMYMEYPLNEKNKTYIKKSNMMRKVIAMELRVYTARVYILNINNNHRI